MPEYFYAQGINWRTNPSNEWEWEAKDGSWQPQATAPRVSSRTASLVWRQNPSGEWEWRADDESWHPADVAPIQFAMGDGSREDVDHEEGDSTPAGAAMAVLAGVLMVVGSFLPWFTAHLGFSTLSRNGYQLGNHYGFSIDGVLVLAFGVISIAIGVSWFTRSQMPWWIWRSPVVVGLACVAVVILRIPGINGLARNVQSASSLVTAGTGIGVIVSIAGGVLSVVAGTVLRKHVAMDGSPVAVPSDVAWQCDQCGGEFTRAVASGTCPDCGASMRST
jgi:Zn finger protein HypA/HybF involved in hydrogenase expression